MRQPELIGIITTLAVVVWFGAFVFAMSLSNPQDVRLLGTDKCGQGTFFHLDTNSCEKFPPKIVWMITENDDEIKIYHKSDGTWKTMDEIMAEEKAKFEP